MRKNPPGENHEMPGRIDVPGDWVETVQMRDEGVEQKCEGDDVSRKVDVDEDLRSTSSSPSVCGFRVR